MKFMMPLKSLTMPYEAASLAAPWWAASIAGIVTNQDPTKNPKMQRTTVSPAVLLMCGSIKAADPAARELRH